MFETLFRYTNRQTDHIHNACRVGSVAVLQEIATIDEEILKRDIGDGERALQVAASYGYFEAVEFLAKAAISRDSRLDFMQTGGAALAASLEAALVFCVKDHFKFRAPDRIKRRSVRLPAKELSRFKAYYSSSESLKESKRAAEFLIDNGALCDSTSPLFGSTLKMAILMGSFSITKRLLAAGVHPGKLDLNHSESGMAVRAAFWNDIYGVKGMEKLLEELGISWYDEHDEGDHNEEGMDEGEKEDDDQSGDDRNNDDSDEQSGADSDEQSDADSDEQP